jgi:hypothetical protein
MLNASLSFGSNSSVEFHTSIMALILYGIAIVVFELTCDWYSVFDLYHGNTGTM